jgi:phospholipid/cholesterol/gamma-HCH transport system permease protein
MLTFFGELSVLSLRGILQPRRIQWLAVWKAVNDTSYGALPIVALLAFLIGVVLAYQLGTQLETYGANIYIVDVTGIAILREFGPLITAILLAGRTSTSFAALIGSMIVNEEVDALRVMGISPIERLVLPRIAGLLIGLPLLIVWADIFAVLGTMVMAKGMFHVDYGAFLARFEYAVALKQYVLGLIKAPVFALIIASAGCFQGFMVKGGADSVGRQTTKAAVQAIFLIIIADAIFSVVYSALGL